MPMRPPDRRELEERIDRYRTLFWRAEDQATRDALRETLTLLECQLDQLDAQELAALQKRSIKPQ